MISANDTCVLKGKPIWKICNIPGVTFCEDAFAKRTRIRFGRLEANEEFDKLKLMAAWLIEKVNAERGKES